MSVHEIEGRKFLIGKLTARQQFDISRRLGFVTYIMEQEVADEHESGARWIAAMIGNSLASVPQAEMDFVLDTCLAVVQVERAGQFKPLWNMAARKPQFEDALESMDTMLEIVDCVIQENLAPFFEKRRAARRKALADQTDDDTNPPA